MKPGEVKIKLHNLDKIDIGEYIITDGDKHVLYSHYLDNAEGEEITTERLKAILRDHTDITYADLGVVFLSDCLR